MVTTLKAEAPAADNGSSKASTNLDEEIVSYDINLPYKPQSALEQKQARLRTEYPDYLPQFDDIWFDKLPEFEYQDPALRADKQKPNLLTPGVTFRHITPKMGTVIFGIKLKELSNAGKDELALLISERKIVAFREQKDFLQAGPQFQQEFMAHFGKLNYQPVTGSITGYSGFHIIHRDGNQAEIKKFFQHKMTSTLWHQDVSYELQPPGYIMLGILACPDVGGDTVFADTAEAYNRLSPTFQDMINGLKAAHTSEKMIGFARVNGGLVRKDPVTSIHPLVRVHPVTGERSIFLNAEFVTGIVGLKDQESDMMLKFLTDHICMGHDFQARVQWEKDSVVMMDGRNTLHTATVDYDSTVQARHIFRLASMTEKPISVGENGDSIPRSNGHNSNEYQTNDGLSNGHTPNGHTSNGHTSNGHTSNADLPNADTSNGHS
ncbi:hypothetical protein MMC17_001143 [Xylographa soralifera]|nr:hypothetical protein [Xylographa soralifera]